MRESTMTDILRTRCEENNECFTQVASEDQSNGPAKYMGETNGADLYEGTATAHDIETVLTKEGTAAFKTNTRVIVNDPNKPLLENLLLAIVKDEATYNNVVPKEYRDVYPYSVSASGLPWLSIRFTRNNSKDTEVKVTIFKDGAPVNIKDAAANLGPITGNSQIVQKSTVWISYDCDVDLGVSTVTGKWQVIVECGGEKHVLEITAA